MRTGLIYLAGGVGQRMQTALPKQFLPLEGKAVALHAFEQFERLAWIEETVVVVDPSCRHFFSSCKRLAFALPGKERMDSVFNGLKALPQEIEMVIVHDAVRPFVTSRSIIELYEAAVRHGAAALATPLKFTVKQATLDKQVIATPDRASLYEIQTPQAARRDLLERGFAWAHAHNKLVTDDVSLVELLNEPVQLVEGPYGNLKITTPDDWELAQALARKFLCVSSS